MVLEPACKGYSKAALLQPVRVVKSDGSGSANNKLIQVKLRNECCEVLGTRLNLSTLKLDLNFRETVSCRRPKICGSEDQRPREAYSGA